VLHVDPAEVGLTVTDQASATLATQLTVGTELFQETVYAAPAVSPEQPELHAVVEGARNRLKLQSQFAATGTPTEAQFFDTGYHYGPPELIQLEGLDSGTPQLVHYRHPWGVGDDGGQTDGLVGDVIMSASDQAVAALPGAGGHVLCDQPVHCRRVIRYGLSGRGH
jgi:hypothetical protein